VKIYLVLFTLVVLAGLWIVTSSASSVNHVFTIAELEKLNKAQRVRVIGKVQDLKILRNENGFLVTFYLTEGDSKIPVIYDDYKPELLTDSITAFVDGDWEDRSLKAARVLTQCPSKYEPAEP
jgi:cytochrome c-type biogenesis protein CcmE